MDKKLVVIPIVGQERDWLYSDESKDAERGAIGHLRMDTGSSGKEFWTSWWPHQNDKLNKEPFCSELDEVVNALRRPELPLSSLQEMQKFCYKHGRDAEIEFGRSYGFKIETADFQYMIRLPPQRGDYSYIYCYDKAAQREFAEKQSVVGQLCKSAEKQAICTPPTKKKQEMER